MIETPTLFGPDAALVGVLTQPAPLASNWLMASIPADVQVLTPLVWPWQRAQSPPN